VASAAGTGPLAALQAARGHLFPLAVVLIGIGVGIWFALPFEPGRPHYAAAAVAGAVSLLFWLAGPTLARPLGAAALAVIAGFLASGLRGHLQEAPMLEGRYYGPVQGRIVALDRSSSDALRLTLADVVLEDLAPARTPVRVRVALQVEPAYLVPAPGQTVILTAHLAAPDGPVEPGGFDFRRMAYFDRLGAVGYTATPVLLWAPPEPGSEFIGRLRADLSAGVRAAIPGDAGAFAAGAMTGDRSGITQETVVALRDSSLAHLLAISGMNMVFLCTFVFALIRKSLALVPPVGLRVNGKKLAAVVSFGVAFFYLLLSGQNVATERAFISISVVLGAVLLDRRAITLRTVAIAGAILLLWKPESLTEPGFQMSFAATLALVAGFAALDRRVLRENWPRWLIPVFTLVASSVIAGVATAPFAAAHFNRFTDYGLIANLLTVPVMGAIIMPMGAIALLLAPLGLHGLPLAVMGVGAEWILAVAKGIAGLEGAVTAIPAPGPAALPLIALGGLWLILWPGRLRLAGAVPVSAALALWATVSRPDLLISEDGRLVGLMTDQGRALSQATAGSFDAINWLENDGDLAPQREAAARPGFAGDKGARAFSFAGLTAVALSGRGAGELLASACAAHDIVVLAAAADGAGGGCILIDQKLLGATGALALSVGDDGIKVTPVRAVERLWTGPVPGPEALPELRANPGPALAADQ
jgi:competence protein ComEC